MQPFDFSSVLNYDGKSRLTPVLAFDYDASSGVITIADNSTYPSGDSRKQINVEVYDKFGGKIEKSFTQEGDYLQDSESSDGVAGSFGIDIKSGDTVLNLTEGVSINATLVSTLGRTSDGSVHDVVTIKTTGTLYMKTVR
jgi:hypothetical protein